MGRKKKYYTEEDKRNAILIWKKRYYRNHRDKILEQKKIYNQNNKDKRKKYYDENKEIIKEKKKIYRQNPENKEKEKSTHQKYLEKNKEKIKMKEKEYRQTHKEKRKLWCEQNPKYYNNYRKERINHDVDFKLRARLRTRLYHAIKGDFKSGSAVQDLGCSIPEFKTYLESKWKDGMTWDNYGFYGWHIDHIIPLDFFNLQDREEFLKACHYTNLQPLWAKDNLEKNDKIVSKKHK